MITLNFYIIFVSPYRRISEKNSKFDHNRFLSNLCQSTFHHLHHMWNMSSDILTTSINELQNSIRTNIICKRLLINGNWQTKSKEIVELNLLDSDIPDCHEEDRVTCNVPWKTAAVPEYYIRLDGNVHCVSLEVSAMPTHTRTSSGKPKHVTHNKINK